MSYSWTTTCLHTHIAKTIPVWWLQERLIPNEKYYETCSDIFYIAIL